MNTSSFLSVVHVPLTLGESHGRVVVAAGMPLSRTTIGDMPLSIVPWGSLVSLVGGAAGVAGVVGVAAEACPAPSWDPPLRDATTSAAAAMTASAASASASRAARAPVIAIPGARWGLAGSQGATGGLVTFMTIAGNTSSPVGAPLRRRTGTSRRCLIPCRAVGRSRLKEISHQF